MTVSDLLGLANIVMGVVNIGLVMVLVRLVVAGRRFNAALADYAAENHAITPPTPSLAAKRPLAVATMLAMGACSSGSISGDHPPEPAASTPQAAASVSFDGTYRGKIRVISHSLGEPNSHWCDTPRAISLSIKQNAFSYRLAHPNLPPDPDLSPTIEVASIAPDGSFHGAPVNGGPEMAGRITGSHIEGEIHGLGCAYAFTAEKVS